jgi:hypothetical protein
MDLLRFRGINAQIPYFASRFQEKGIPIIDKFDMVIRGMDK